MTADLVDLDDALPLGYEAVVDTPSRSTMTGRSSPTADRRAPRAERCPARADDARSRRCPVHATPAHPTVATVDSPNAGAVTVTEAATNDAPPVGSGYTFLGHQLNITAPAASTAAPISIIFKVDATLLASVTPNLTAADVAVFRNGTPVAAVHATSSDDPATPDPCVSQRQTLSGGTDAGDAQITVLTSAASHWNVGFIATRPARPPARPRSAATSRPPCPGPPRRTPGTARSPATRSPRRPGT